MSNFVLDLMLLWLNNLLQELLELNFKVYFSAKTCGEMEFGSIFPVMI